MKKGFFITFEGCDGSGKSTTLEDIVSTLTNEGYDIVKTREPGGSAIAQQIRNILLDENNQGICSSAEALLFAASRAQHYEEVIKPALLEGKIVICDRFIDSSLAYQGHARGLGLENIKVINAFAIEQTMPDLTVFFNLQPQKGLERIAKSNEREVNRLDLEGLNFHNKVYEGYLNLLDTYPDRMVSINADQTKEAVYTDVLSLIKERLNEQYNG